MFVFIHSLASILAGKSSSKIRFDDKEFGNLYVCKRVLKSSIPSQTWDGDVLGCKALGIIQLPLERGLAVQS